MNKPLDNLDVISDGIRLELIAQDNAREKALPLSREVIRMSGQAIRAIHRHEFETARRSLETGRRLLDEASAQLSSCAALPNTHFIWDAEKEFAEAGITLALVTGEAIPTPNALGVNHAAYLNGMAEGASELRRFLLDSLRKGDFSRGEELLEAMDDIYNVLITMDFPDSLTGGLRRTTDALRGVLEKTRSDLTLSIQQKRLEDRLDNLGKI
ncbi:MAG: haloacid dehalogenase [Dehalococcoidia bacterium]|nr:haloacid dehalogenase [Dehalococcoidia bacterium]